MKKRSVAQLNYELWSQCERDMGKLQEMILEENYGLAREQLRTISQTARRSGDALGDSKQLSDAALSATDERRLLWNKAAQKANGVLRRLEAREYGKAEAEAELLLSDIRLHTQTAIEEYNRDQRKNPS